MLGVDRFATNPVKVVEKELISRWLELSSNNIIQLLHHLDVGNSEQDFKVRITFGQYVLVTANF